MSKNKTLAIVAAVAAFAAVSASAATLGGLSGTSLGADATLVSSCDSNGVVVAYTTAYVGGAAKEYQASAVNVTGIDPTCAGKALNLTLADASGVSLGSGTVASIVGTTATVTLGAPVSAKAVSNVAVVIAG
jgi:hypothetical protein